jgi:hypothetical protein
MNFKNLLSELLVEANKRDVLITKLGLSEKNADVISKICGPFSVFMANKIIDIIQKQIIKDRNRDFTRQETVEYLNGGYAIQTSKTQLTTIMDWVRTGLNGNVKPYQNFTYDQLFQASKKWHDELGVGNGEINYVEENEILLDYRDEGIGFYWVNLNTNTSDEECDRMGHCGRTSSDNTIYSLREVKRFNEKYTINKSHLTAAIGNRDGIVYQMKGPKNSKPQEKYYPYIIDLLLKNEDIKGFGSEYNSSDDFSLGDLPEDKIKEIYSQKPILFDNRKGKRILQKIGVLPNRSTENMVFDLQIDPAYISRYVDGDWNVRKWKDSHGNQRSSGMFETLLSGDYWDLFDGHGGDWESAMYSIDEENTKIIQDLIRGITNPEEIEGMSLNAVIKEFDNNHEIRNALGNALSSAESDSYYEYYKRTLQNALEEYGEVIQLNDEGAIIRINLQSVIDNHGVNEDDLDDYFERCDDKYECVFDELMGDYYDKPNFRIDDRWTPDVNEDYFNEILNDYLGDVRM